MLAKQTLCKTLLSPGLLICFLALASCGEESKDGSASVSGKELSLKKVIVALKPTDNPEKVLAVKDELENFLSDKLKRVVEITIPANTASVTESFRSGKIDVGYLSPSDAARNLELGTASVLLARTEDGNPHYKSIWVCKKGKEYSSIADLENKPIAFTSRSSESGYLIPAWDLANRELVGPGVALTDYFSQVLYCNGYASAAKKVLGGEAEAAAIADYTLHDETKSLSDGEKSQLKTFQEQGPVATDIICIRSSLSSADRKLLKEAFMSMNADNPELCNRAFRGKLEVVDEREHLKVILEAIAVQKTLKP
jgi:phosphonate transport system substrate-binding protein